MKTITLAIIALITVHVTAQTTHNINWFIGADPGTLVIEAGDTVNWFWTDGASHSVTSAAGSDTAFDSGILGSGSEFSFTFNDEGINPYACQVHPGMVGVIEVGALSVDNNSTVQFSFYPNPVKDYLFIDAPKVIDNVKLFDIAGKLLMDAPIDNKKTSVYMGVFKSGVYFAKVQMGGTTQTIRVVLE